MLDPFRTSDQQRKIEPGGSDTIKMLKVPSGMNYMLKRVYIKPLSYQAKQDLIITLKAGSRNIFQLGKYVPGNSPFPTEDRTTSTSGLIYSSISSSSGSGRGDNFYNFDPNLIEVIKENTEILFDISNQSAVYKHGIVVSISGFLVVKKMQK